MQKNYSMSLKLKIVKEIETGKLSISAATKNMDINVGKPL